MEKWALIQGYNKYYISNKGRVKSCKFSEKGKIRKEVYTQGYCKISLCKDNKVKMHSIHRLVAKAFIPNPENKPQVNHIDGDKSNNHVYNLEWATARENTMHAIKNGNMIPLGNAKLKKEDVIEIRRLNEDGLTHVEIAKMYPVKVQSIRKILDGRSWSHV